MMCARSIAQLVLLTADLVSQVCFPAKTNQTELLADQSLLCTYGPRHEKHVLGHMRTAKAQVILHIRTV